LTDKEELLQEELFTNSSIRMLLICLDTGWDGPARHEESNPYIGPCCAIC
jgi:hypothetical protein